MQLKFSNTSILIFDINVVQSSNSRRSVAQPKLKPNWNIHFYKTTLKWGMKSVSNVNSFSREMICAVLNIYYGCKNVSDSVNRLQKTTYTNCWDSQNSFLWLLQGQNNKIQKHFYTHALLVNIANVINYRRGKIRLIMINKILQRSLASFLYYITVP